jgi:HSP20 family protein
MMLVRYWQPWREIETLRNQINQVFDELAHQTDETLVWKPAIELKDLGETLVLKAELPGMDAKDLDIQVTKNSVSLSGEHRQETKSEQEDMIRTEFRYGQFRRLIQLPAPIQHEQVQAEYKDGVLTLTLPKVTEAVNKVVKVQLAELPTETTATAVAEPATEASTEESAS